jgi:hypothetical protein
MKNENLSQITSAILSKEKLKFVFKDLIALLIQEKIAVVEITYGFAWGNEIYESEWKPIAIPPEKIETLVDEQTEKGTGEIGQDDFYINIKSEKIQIQFCHENDVHIDFQHDSQFLGKIKSILKPEEWIRMKKSNESKWKKINDAV